MAQSVSETESSKRLTLDSLRDVLDALYDVRSKWEYIGIELELSKNDTDAIKKETENKNVLDCLTEMLSVYLKRANPEPSWSSIIAALKARAVGESRLAQSLEQKYLSRISRQQMFPEPQRDHLQAQQNQGSDQTELSFPYHDTLNKLSPHVRKDLIQRLSSDYNKILQKFATLQAHLCESLKRQNISVETIANCALSLALYKSDDVPRPLPAEEQESLEEARTVDRIFILLRKYKLISYFDHGIVKHIIETHGTEDDKYKLKEYVDEFQEFCKRKLYEVPPMISERTSHTPSRKFFKILITADMRATLIDIAAAERKVADILGLAHSALTLHEITPGSLVLTLSIPILIADKIFPLRASQLSQLKDNGFTILSDWLSVTLHDVSIEMKTVKYAKELWKKIEDEFHLSDCNAVLDHIHEAESIVVEWFIPPTAFETLLKPHAQPWSAIDFLQKEGIVRVMLNDSCIYDIQESKKLLELCNEGSFNEVILLLKSQDKGAAINATFEEIYKGKSALMLVCERGHISLVLTLLDSGAEIKFQQKTTGRSALHLAAKNGHLSIVRFLLAYGADPNLMDLSGATAASVATQEDHASLSDELHNGKPKPKIRTRNLLQYASDTIEEWTKYVLKPGFKLYQRIAMDLVGASRSNDLESVRYIIDEAKNLDINIRESDKHAWTALMWATDKDNLEMVKLLLANNADPNIAAKDNLWTSLMLATRQGNLKVVKILLDHGADPNAQNSKGLSSMSLAVYEHHTEIAMLLVHRGAEVNIIEEDGNSPLTHACVENNVELVKLFCDYNANMNHQGKNGWTPLMEAAHGGFQDVVEELAKRGADLNMTSGEGDSAIHVATVKGLVDVVRVLAHYGADLNMPNKDGLTALMVAADKGYQGIVEALLEGGVDVNYKHQATGWPAIFFAAKNGRVSILKKLLERGAVTELETGLKVVDVASFFNRRAIINEIRKKPQQVQPLSPYQQIPLVEVPGIEDAAIGIELTPFTKKDTTVGEDEKQKSTQDEESHDTLDDMTLSESTAIGQKQPEKLDKLEARTQSVSQLQTESLDPCSPSTVDIVGSEANKFQEREVVESAESVDEVETEDQPKSTDNITPEHVLEGSPKDHSKMTTEEKIREPEMKQETEQQEPILKIRPKTVEDTVTTSQLTAPEEHTGNQPVQSRNQDIAKHGKAIDLLLQAMYQRMNIENEKKSKGVSDFGRINPAGIDART